MRQVFVEPLISIYSWLNNWKAFRLPIVRSLFVHSYFFYKTRFEDPFAQLISTRPELFTRGHLLDIGANIGYTAVVFASALKGGDKVFAFEPERENFDRLVENLKRFGVKDQVVASCVAVGAEVGSVDIWVNRHHPGDHRTVTAAFRSRIEEQSSIRKVPIVSVDSFVTSKHLLNQIGFIKIDIQGYELEACRGMEKTLAANPRATVAVEYAPHQMVELGFSPSALIDFFIERGFNIYELQRGGRLKSLSRGDLSVETDSWTNLLCSREQL